jgi:hypothetical protein
MSRPQFVRPIRPNETQQFIEWVKDQPEFDSETPTYPTSTTLAGYDKEKVVAYITAQRPFVLESLAANPGATDLELASVMREFVQFLVSQSHIQGVGEIYFLESDKNTSEFASNHIFEKLPVSVYRLKIRDLEPR